MYGLEMWGGIDYPLNRIGDEYFHRGEKRDHDDNIQSLQMFVELGIKKIRIPCLWELVSPKDLDRCHWHQIDAKLDECQKLGVQPVVHFLHHGSGPTYTSLIDPDFPEKFATYARAFAKRYPWVEDYSLINDIFLTARMSCLEEEWYPHLNSKTYFLKAIYLQCQASILAMKEIRRVNPRARMIQTEELGQSPKSSKYKNDLATNYRWLALDLLCGKIDEHHDLYGYLLRGGLTEQELIWSKENACTPSMIGINLFEKETHENLIQEAWNRYRIPLALTQTQAQNSHDIQQLWNTAKSFKNASMDVRAVTAWSQTASYDWYQDYTNCEPQFNPEIIPMTPNLSSLHP